METRTLRRSGWRVLRIWEHELRWAVRNSAKGKSTHHPGPLPGRGGEGEARLVGRLLGRVAAAVRAVRESEHADLPPEAVISARVVLPLDAWDAFARLLPA